ncbi:MAG: trimeric intracellular cation channel family protein [Candidatus Nanopelagicaceae bacterium]
MFSLDLIATFAFAVVGARIAINRNMDYAGIILIALVASLTGGTLRNIFLGIAPSWLNKYQYFLAVIVAVIFAIAAPARKPVGLFILSIDTFGLAVAVVSGTQFAIEKDAPLYAAALLGITTAVAGGLLRDVLCQVEPILLHRETIGTSSGLGALSYIALESLSIDRSISAVVGGMVVIAVRALSIKFDLHLPRAK